MYVQVLYVQSHLMSLCLFDCVTLLAVAGLRATADDRTQDSRPVEEPRDPIRRARFFQMRERGPRGDQSTRSSPQTGEYCVCISLRNAG